jgi:hypothetical protein
MKTDSLIFLIKFYNEVALATTPEQIVESQKKDDKTTEALEAVEDLEKAANLAKENAKPEEAPAPSATAEKSAEPVKEDVRPAEAQTKEPVVPKAS